MVGGNKMQNIGLKDSSFICNKICSGCDNVPVFDIAACGRELYEFIINVLHLNGERLSMKDACRVLSQRKAWHLRHPNMLKVWQSILVIPASTIACERGGLLEEQNYQ